MFVLATYCLRSLTSSEGYDFQIDQQQIGKVLRIQNDLRVKSPLFWGWRPVGESRPLHENEAIFAGESSEAEIELIDGTNLIIKENSLVDFKNLKNGNWPDLKLGSFKVKMNGKTTLSLNGKLRQFSGKNAELEITRSADNSKTEIKVISGEVKVQQVADLEHSNNLLREPTEDNRPIAEINLVQNEKIEIENETLSENLADQKNLAQPTTPITPTTPAPAPTPITEQPAQPTSTPPLHTAAVHEEKINLVTKKKIAPVEKKYSNQIASVSPPKELSKNESIGSAMDTSANGPADKSKYKFELGLGGTWFDVKQNFSDIDVEYYNLTFPSYNLGVIEEFSDQRSYALNYSSTLFSFDNSKVGYSTRTARLQILDAQYSKPSNISFHPGFISNHFSTKLKWNFNLQIQEVPLSLFDATTFQPLQREYRSINLGAGMTYEIYQEDNVKYSVTQNLQFPVYSMSATSTTQFKLSNSLIYNGSISYEKKILEKTWLGGRWKGQYQLHNLTFKDSNIISEGTQTILFSTMEVMLKTDF